MRASILAEVSVDRAWEHVEKLTAISPQRLSGTETEKEVAQYLAGELKSCGVDATVYSVPGVISFPGPSSLAVTFPENRAIPCSTFAQIGSTPAGGIEAQLVYLRSGGEEEYAGQDVRGKIVLVDLSYAPPRPEKVRLATVHGAAGVVMANWGKPEHGALPLGTVKSVWGNPTPEALSIMPVLPVVGITRRDGDYLIDLLSRSNVRVRLEASASRLWKEILEPVGRLDAGDEGTYVLLGGHYDAWGGGVTCNATGNALVLELARVFSQHRAWLRRGITVGFWPGHETGIMVGSTWFVDNFWDDLQKRCVLYINVDSPGMLGASQVFGYVSPEVVHFFKAVTKELTDAPIGYHRLTKIGDQSFLGIGVPSLFELSHHTGEEIREWKGATLGWWYHSTLDTIDKADRQVLDRDLKCTAGYLWEFCTRPVLPFRMAPVADEFRTRLGELASLAEGAVDLRNLIEVAEEFVHKAQAFDTAAEALAASVPSSPGAKLDQRLAMACQVANQAMMKVSRAVTWVRATMVDRYEQDTYGLSYLSQPLPSISRVAELRKYAPGTELFYAWHTRLIRERNKCGDALAMACSILGEAHKAMREVGV